jgi:hypothetical protein
MVKLSTLKNRFKLAVKTHLNPVKRNDTRWGSQFHELLRYLELRETLPTCAFSRATKDMLPTTGDTILITELVVKLYKCELTSKFLQSHDAHKITLLSVRMAFDRLIAQIPELAAKLGPDADVVHSPAFEKAVIKLQKGENLSPVYKAQVAMFKVAVVLPAEGKEEKLTFEEIIARAVEASKTQDLWSQKTLQDIIDRKKEFNREAARKRREEQELQAAHDREDDV